MSYRSIALSLALLSGCATTDGGGGPDAMPSAAGEILKVSYFRAYPDPRNQQKLDPTYRVVMSYSWRDLIGESPREPFPKAAPGKIYVGFLSDAEVISYFKELRKFGIDRLKPRKPEEFKPEDLVRLSTDPKTTRFTRVFTIGTDKWSRSYYYPDHHDVRNEALSKELIPIYTKCEAFVARVCENSVNVRTLSDPIVPKQR